MGKPKRMSKKPFSKCAVSYVLFLASAFLIWACYEMHRLNDLTPIAYIGTGVVGLIAAALGFYVWRAKASDTYDLAVKKSKKEQELGVGLDFDADNINVNM